METISNEEKAKEFATSYDGKIIGFARIAALQMAQWKDEQIDTILLTTECCLRSFFESKGNTQESIDNFIDALKKQIDKNLNKYDK